MKKIIFTAIAVYSSCAYSLHKVPREMGISFYDSMANVQARIPSIINIKEWQQLEAAYNKHVLNNLQYNDECRIPKIIHQIWIGSPLPEKYKKFQQSWIKNHPGWQYKLWTDKDIKDFGLIHQKMYDAAKNVGAKSDIARYEILYRLGGLYVDTDFECLKPMDVFHHCFDFYTGAAYFPTCTAFMAIISAVPGHPILKECLDSLDLHKVSNPGGLMGILVSTGPGHFSKALNKHLQSNTDRSVAFPAGYFYPWPHYKLAENKPEQISRWIRPETFAIHHWHVSWKKIENDEFTLEEK